MQWGVAQEHSGTLNPAHGQALPVQRTHREQWSGAEHTVTLTQRDLR